MRPAAGAGLVAVLALTLYLVTGAPGITWRNGGIDSGELATAVATGSVAHPPGYATYLLLGRVVTLLPLEPARALAWLSALCAALACACVVRAAQRELLTGHTIGQDIGHTASPVVAVAPGMWLATAPLLWASATYAEVNAPMALVTGLWLALRGWAPRPARHLLWIGALHGLALGIHALLVVLAGGTAVGQLWGPRPAARLAVLAALAALAAGRVAGAGVTLGALAFFPPTGPVNWYAPQTVEGWRLLVTADAYRGLLSPSGAPLGLLWMLRAVVENLAFVGAIAAAAGLQEVLARRGSGRPVGTLLCAGLAAVYILFSALYAARDAEAYLLPALILLTPAVARGLHTAVSGVPASVRAPLLIALVVAPPAIQVLVHGAALDLRRDRSAMTYAETVLDAAPREAVIVASGDAPTFALWYARYALGRRTDVAVLNEDLLAHTWYRAHIGTLHPRVIVPPLLATDVSAVELLSAANPGRVSRAPAPPPESAPQ